MGEQGVFTTFVLQAVMWVASMIAMQKAVILTGVRNLFLIKEPLS